MDQVRGTFWVLLQYNVSESVDLARLRELLGSQRAAQRDPAFPNPAPDYVRFEKPPVVAAFAGEAGYTGRIKYFDYGVASVELSADFDTTWDQLIELTGRWMNSPELEASVRAAVRREIDRLNEAFSGIHEEWLAEDYYIVRLTPSGLSAADLIAQDGGRIVQVIRGESRPLSDHERDEALRSSMSYYRDDLLVAGWLAAFVYDTEIAASTMIELLGFANSQLLELRYYDEMLTRVLAGVYKSLDRGGGLLRRWKMAREAERLNRMRLDITELAERSDNSIKFLSDMFYARAYAVAAAKIGVGDYRTPVEEKLHTAGELYEFMVNEFHQSRAFVLEAMVVAILIIELVFLFRGKS